MGALKYCNSQADPVCQGVVARIEPTAVVSKLERQNIRSASRRVNGATGGHIKGMARTHQDRLLFRSSLSSGFMSRSLPVAAVPKHVSVGQMRYISKKTEAPPDGGSSGGSSQDTSGDDWTDWFFHHSSFIGRMLGIGLVAWNRDVLEKRQQEWDETIRQEKEEMISMQGGVGEVVDDEVTPPNGGHK